MPKTGTPLKMSGKMVEVPMATSQIPRIEVFQYKGYHGGFAPIRKLLWKAVLIGVNEERRDTDPNVWHGHPSSTYALDSAQRWANFLGWPIINLGRQEKYDDPIKEGRIEHG